MKTTLPILSVACLVSALGVATGAPAAPAYDEPAVFTGTVYETASGTNQVLFTFKRHATRSNTTVHVVREFANPNGTLAARETMKFVRGQLVSFQLDEKQTGARGSATVSIDTKSAGKLMLLFDWVTTEGGKTKTKTDREVLQPDTLVAEMIPYFIVERWNALARGVEVPFRFIVPSRLETVGFKFVKEAEVTWRGQPALRLRMEPSSIVIRQIVDPLFFIVQKDGAHRVLEYVGRTTPKHRDGEKWKDLDARTVYDWP